MSNKSDISAVLNARHFSPEGADQKKIKLKHNHAINRILERRKKNLRKRKQERQNRKRGRK